MARPQGRRSARTRSCGTCPTRSTCWPSPSRPASASRAPSAIVCEQLRLPAGRRVLPYAAGDGAGPPPPGGPPEPEAPHRGAGAIELRAGPDPGRRPRHADRPGPEDPGRRRCGSKRRQWAREKAAKLPVKILFPLVLFIFPADLRRRARVRRPRRSAAPSASQPARRAGRSTRLAPFRPAILAIRWGTTAVSASPSPTPSRPRRRRALGRLVGALLARLRRLPHGPARSAYGDDARAAPRACSPRSALTVARRRAPPATGTRRSSSRCSPPVVVAGFARGFGFGAAHRRRVARRGHRRRGRSTPTSSRTTCRTSGAVGRRAAPRGPRRRLRPPHLRRGRPASRSSPSTALGRLADANALLFSLHRVAQTLPASLDLDEVLDSTMSRLRDLFDFDAAALLVLDDTDGRWLVARRDGRPAPGPHRRPTSSPAASQRAARAAHASCASRTCWPAAGPGLAPRSRRASTPSSRPAARSSGSCRSSTPRPTTSPTATSSCSSGFVEPAALAIDNARWFGRLRTVGADEERTRIARDLHDRIGQSLAYLAFELDRIVKTGDERRRRRPRRSTSSASDVRDGDRRGARHALRPAHRRHRRARASSPPLELFLERVRDRSRLRGHAARRRDAAACPLPQERELLRIAQEAVANVERHARRQPRHRHAGAATAPTRRARGRRRRQRLPGRAGRPPRLLRPRSACGSGPRASAPPSTSTPTPGRGHAGPLHASTPGRRRARRPATPGAGGSRARDDPAAAGRRPPACCARACAAR